MRNLLTRQDSAALIAHASESSLFECVMTRSVVEVWYGHVPHVVIFFEQSLRSDVLLTHPYSSSESIKHQPLL